MSEGGGKAPFTFGVPIAGSEVPSHTLGSDVSAYSVIWCGKTAQHATRWRVAWGAVVLSIVSLILATGFYGWARYLEEREEEPGSSHARCAWRIANLLVGIALLSLLVAAYCTAR